VAAVAGARSYLHTIVDVTLPLLLHVENHVEVALLIRLRIRRRNGRLEEAQIADTLVATYEGVFPEDVTGDDEDLIADARLRRDVVAEDVDAIHDRGLTLGDFPAEVDRRHRVG